MNFPRALLLLAALGIGLALVITKWDGQQTPEGESRVSVLPGQANGGTDEPAQDRQQPEPLRMQDESRLPVPPHLRFAGIVDVPVAESWDALLEQWSDEDRTVIEGFASSLDRSAYFFNGKEEFAWLVAQGFPTPCGEHGEIHTLISTAPGFAAAMRLEPGNKCRNG